MASLTPSTPNPYLPKVACTRFFSCVRWPLSTIRVRGSSWASRTEEEGIHTVGNVPVLCSRFIPLQSRLSLLLTLPIISLANRALTSCGFPPPASISSTTQYQFPTVSTATAEPGIPALNKVLYRLTAMPQPTLVQSLSLRSLYSSIERGCEVMGLSRSTYYYRSKAPSVHDEKEGADLRDRIEQIVVEHSRYGYRRVTWQLKREGWEVNPKRVARIMREESLQCQVKRRWARTTDSNHGYRVYPNRLKGLEVMRPNQVWVADITYIRIVVGFLYLAVVLDLYSRKVIGWALSEQIDAELSVEALKMVLEQRGSVKG